MLSWIASGLLSIVVSWTFGYFFVMAFMRMSGDKGLTTRREERTIKERGTASYSDAAIAQFGHG